jgi:tetratricopeptide (TPR) repeat protein
MLSGFALAMATPSAYAAPMDGAQKADPARAAAPAVDSAAEVSAALDAALKRGQWQRACGVATASLGRGEANVDALGIFGACSALANDQTAANTALQRLREVEAAPYYASLTEGILQLRGGAPAKADATFAVILKARPDDPLALYFDGEALHQLKRDPQAIAAFKAVLKRWPDHAPALAAAARLMAAPKASPQALKEAATLTERATVIEPMNLDYWKQMADLYERTGQADRAAAVKLQWLSPPKVK